MGLMFLLSGYFTAPSFRRKGAARFLADRLLRLGLPTVVFMLGLQPLAHVIGRAAGPEHTLPGLAEAKNAYVWWAPAAGAPLHLRARGWRPGVRACLGAFLVVEFDRACWPSARRRQSQGSQVQG